MPTTRGQSRKCRDESRHGRHECLRHAGTLADARRLSLSPARRGRGRRGSALLAVLWLSAALAAIAFSLANTVRGEAERAGTAADGLRAYYLAVGGIERTALRFMWLRANANLPPALRLTTPSLDVLQFPGGEVRVEIIPETAKLNINTIKPEDLFRLLLNLGVDGGRAHDITAAAVDWRAPMPPGTPGPFDAYYLSMTPSFRSRHASFEETEELLLLKGMTPDIYYGTYERRGDAADAAALEPRGGLADCVSVFGTVGVVDANTAHPAVMAAVGVPPDAIAALVQRRRTAPFRNDAELSAFLGGNPARPRLRVGANVLYTLRATARLRLPDGKLSDLRRSVAATVKFKPVGWGDDYQVLRWYDMAWGKRP